MSAIIAGKSCGKCKRPYWHTFGHPKWYDDVVWRKRPKSEQFLKFEKMAKSGMCPKCYAESEEKKNENIH